jgi:hypothetical protein
MAVTDIGEKEWKRGIGPSPGNLLFFLVVEVGVFLLEFLNSAFHIHHLLLTGEERMAGTANVRVDLTQGGARRERVATNAGNFGFFIIFGMNFRFHNAVLHLSVMYVFNTALDPRRVHF